MGIEAVAKQAQSRILICSLGPLGVEIAKNIVLAGCKELILFDTVAPTADQLSGQFFISLKDLTDDTEEKTRAEYSYHKIQELNYYVKVTLLPRHTVLTEYLASQKEPIKVVVLTDLHTIDHYQLREINETCRKHKIAMISAFQNGLFGKVFNDFGPEFTVLDKDGEELQEVMIKDISYSEERQATVVTLLDGFKHRFEDGDQVVIKEVKGMAKLEGEGSINDSIGTITSINPQSFKIDIDSRHYGPYQGNGIAKQVKVPRKVQFKSLRELDEDKAPAFDENLLYSDFEKVAHKQLAHFIYEAFHQMDVIERESIDQVDLGGVLFKKVKELVPEELKSGEK